ncbi:Scramblase [Protomyces lactucae-debilis]|uniref:Phospholipid scramblase n=1 Tax=Protomyces lactucae-debilis TaxID=2754530 RepID=A0A1Y2F5A2_PROLT|nr:Scramblase [Protomyces lactucae-debilis]ORY79041.1 Scramblase [Protomyces lactucae-debilis]
MVFGKLKLALGKDEKGDLTAHASQVGLTGSTIPGVCIHSEASRILASLPIVICRQYEPKNAVAGIEEPNKYLVKSSDGRTIAQIDEEVRSSTMKRSLQGNARKYACHLTDLDLNKLLSVQRGFSLAEVKHEVSVYTYDTPDSEGILVGTVKSKFHLVKRKYDLFLQQKTGLQLFAVAECVSAGTNFDIVSIRGEYLGSVNRAKRGGMKDAYTSTGMYVLRDARCRHDSSASALPVEDANLYVNDPESKDAAKAVKDTAKQPSSIIAERDMFPAERAVILALSIAMDFQYFSYQYNTARSVGVYNV